jgi:hypothetical protein
LIGTVLGRLVWIKQSCWGVLWISKRPQVSPLEIQRNWQHDTWCLMTNTQANRVSIVSSVITRYLTLANKGQSTFHPSVFVHVQFSVYPLLFICCYSTYCQLFSDFLSFLLFDYLWYYFCLVRSVFFDYSVSFSVLILELYSRYFKPHNTISTTIRQVNKHHTQDCAYSCLSLGSKILLQS